MTTSKGGLRLKRSDFVVRASSGGRVWYPKNAQVERWRRLREEKAAAKTKAPET